MYIKNGKGGCEMTFKRYDIVMADLGKTSGSIQSGTRPCLIVQNDTGNLHSPTTIVMPLSTRIKNPNQPTHALIKRTYTNGLAKDSMVLGEQMRVISRERISHKLGTVDNKSDQEAIRRVYFASFGE